MTTEKKLIEFIAVIKKELKKKDEFILDTIRRIEEDFIEKFNEMADRFNKSNNIKVLNFFESEKKGNFKSQISFVEEPEFLKKLKHTTTYLRDDHPMWKNVSVKLGDVTFYWATRGE